MILVREQLHKNVESGRFLYYVEILIYFQIPGHPIQYLCYAKMSSHNFPTYW